MIPTASGDHCFSQLCELIEGVELCMLTTMGEDGQFHSRPMRLACGLDDDHTLLFFSRNNSHKVTEAKQDERANVTFAHPGQGHYVSLVGTLEIVEDRETVQACWREDFNAFFPEGPGDKSLLLLRFHADRAEYWDSQTNVAVIAYERAKARFTGKFPNLCDHEKVELNG